MKYQFNVICKRLISAFNRLQLIPSQTMDLSRLAVLAWLPNLWNPAKFRENSKL